MKIAFVWQGVSNPYQWYHWRDGLRFAMNEVEKHHEVIYREPWHDIKDVDLILYWEAPLTINSPENSAHYRKVKGNSIKKILLFAGGPIKKEWVQGFDMLLLESKINEQECDSLGIRWQHAFGVNTDIFKPMTGMEKKWDGMLHATCHSGKRQGLIGQALGVKGFVMGKGQETDKEPFEECRRRGSRVIEEALVPEQVAFYLNQSHCLINLSNADSGGQRATLEAMACGIPVIVAHDSPKNREFVEESGFGLIVEPDVNKIKEAVDELKNNPKEALMGIGYVAQNFSGQIYAQQLLKAINEV